MDEEEEEMERNINKMSDSMEGVDNISDSKEGVEDKSDSKEGVEDRNNSAEQVDVLNNSKKMVVGGSDPKSNPIWATDTINGISATDTTNGISTRKLHPLFVKPTQIGNQEIFSQSNSSTARGGTQTTRRSEERSLG